MEHMFENNTHKRQLAWQILAPFFLAAGIILASAILLLTKGIPTTRTWADIAIIWLILPLLILSLLLLVLLGTLIYALLKGTGLVLTYSHKAQSGVGKVAGWLKKGSDGIVKPVIRINQFKAILDSIFRLN